MMITRIINYTRKATHLSIETILKKEYYGNSNNNQYCLCVCIINICVILIDRKIISSKLFV